MTKNPFEMTVCVNGRPIREYGHIGLTFVEGHKGQTYTIKFRNNSACRVLAVFSVDGIEVIDGQPADNDARGYIVPAYQQIEITGWRTSLSATNEFVFDSKQRANSTQQQGEDTNCGVIAVKVFSEELTMKSFAKILRTVVEEHHHHHYPPPPPPPPPPLRPPWEPYITWSHTGAPMMDEGHTVSYASLGLNEPTYGACKGDPGPLGAVGSPGEALAANFVSPGVSVHEQDQSAVGPEFNLGTGWGREREDRVTESVFKRGFELAELSIYYSDKEGLTKAGIEVDKKATLSKPVLPRGFHGFCKPPVVTS